MQSKKLNRLVLKLRTKQTHRFNLFIKIKTSHFFLIPDGRREKVSKTGAELKIF
ncbi:hypothetical protein HWC99_gp23 [Flavobacterium phage vB_FspS_tant8-1]|uniref:Uncharacterized protein n=1 Tax=Flavobacterium phage vB_FspS_tant8-1 TaxID=2686278 RepID=A0A6B9LV16_9CAUD|nr:hypothetical protein HWC99_gp23 [Flavobacterium phage vB_FspS_tant8-1]QHB40954.1 hypothetical protein tant81_gp023 [Flavobacterium phage vB_FspS_tant8-1]